MEPQIVELWAYEWHAVCIVMEMIITETFVL